MGHRPKVGRSRKRAQSPSWPLANGRAEIPCPAKTCTRREQLLLILHFSFCNLHFAICNSRCDFGRRPHGQTVGGVKRTTRQLQRFTTIQTKPPTMRSTLATRQWLSFFLISANFPLLQKISSHFLSFALICSKFPAKSGPPREPELGRLCRNPTHLCRKRTNSVGNLSLFRRPNLRQPGSTFAQLATVQQLRTISIRRWP